MENKPKLIWGKKKTEKESNINTFNAFTDEVHRFSHFLSSASATDTI